MSDPSAEPSALKLAMLARDVRARVAGILNADPIAVVGMACRVPGADSLEAYWSVLAEGRDTTSEVPADRWDNDLWYDPEVAAPGKAATRRGGFLDQIDGFDANFFNILPREADTMDPQQRLFLECAIEALDDAGQVGAGLRGSRTGVFIASYHSDYAGLSYRDLANVDLRTLTGTVHSVVPNRLSYLLDLRGPSVSIDTACSSSLVAIHMACQSLRSGESDMALAGGVSLMITPDLMVSLSKVGFMAPDGRCKAFDAAADGFGRGEGCGVMVLRRLSDAIAEGDRIHAVIRGSAVNQDGESTLLTAPNGPAQESLIREALAAARLSAESISFIEAHGTGTALGDPIEVGALAATVGRPVEGGSICYVGTAKANIGHLEAAAGVVGAIKSALALKHRVLPPQPLFHALNPDIDLHGTRLRISKEPVEFDQDIMLRCGVSGFGVGGTNAHIVLEEAPRLSPVGSADLPVGPIILPLTVKDPAALADLARNWASFLRATTDPLDDITYTAARRRTHHAQRLAVVGHSKEDLADALTEFSETGFSRGVQQGTSGRRKLAMVFCGQGPQWFGMAQGLASASAVFREALDACDAALAPHWQTSLTTELSRNKDDSRLHQTAIAQPALFAVQVALARMWMARGIRPDAVTGHSVGEIAALHVAGVIDLSTAARIVAHRGRIMQKAEGNGAMASLAVTEKDALRRIERFGDRLSLAAVNAPRSCVLSGDSVALDTVIDDFERDGIEARRLPIRYAFHSAQMEPFALELRAVLQGIATTPPAISFVSTVTGNAMERGFTADYFARNMCEPVRFAAATEHLVGGGYDCFLEIGPHPVLGSAIAETARATEVTVFASLRRSVPDAESIALASAGLFATGVDPDWSVLAPDGAVVTLPPYPWQRRRHWLPEPSIRDAIVSRTQRLHPVLSRRVTLAPGDTHLFEGDARDIRGWSGDHQIFGRTPLPGAAIAEGFLAAAQNVLGETARLKNLTILKPVEITDTADCWQIVARQTATLDLALEWHVESESVWRLAASATGSAAQTIPEEDEWPRVRPGGPVNHSRFTRSGIAFGPCFSLLSEIRMDQGIATAALSVPPDGAAHILHPALLDAAFQLALIAAEGEIDAPDRVPSIPVAIASIQLARPAEGPLKAEAHVTERGAASCLANVTLFDSSGACCARIEGLRLLRAQKELGIFSAGQLSLERVWQTLPDEEPSVHDRDWLVVDVGGSAETVRDLRRAAGSDFHLAVTDLGNRDEVAGRIHALYAQARPPTGVVLCLNLDPAQSEVATAADAVIGAVHVVQAILATALAPLPALRLLVRQAQSVAAHEPVNPSSASLWGAMGALAIEHPDLAFRAIDADPSMSPAAMLNELIRTGPQWTAIRNGLRLSPRLAQPAPQNGKNALRRLSPTGQNAIEAIALSPLTTSGPGPGEVRIGVRCSGLNFRDILVALGAYPGAPATLGAECSGVVLETGTGVTRFKTGDRVMGMVPLSHATEAIASEDQLVQVPHLLSDAVAAGQPVAYLTACYGLERLAGIKRGDKVLIHAAAGGVGLAALRIAKSHGAQIFATAGSDEKRAFLLAEGAAHVFDSREASFAKQILKLTDGKGVGIVLNSLAGDFICESLRATAPGGCFLELGKRDILSRERAAELRDDVTYLPYDLGDEVGKQTGLLPELMDSLLKRFETGDLAPLPVREFDLDKAQAAFRFVAEAKHIGKVVLRATHPPFAITPDGVYWITGGLGAIGLDTAGWLAGHGARKLVLSGRQPPNERAAAVIAELKADGVEVHVLQADASDRSSMAKVRERIAEIGTLRGVVHAAGVLRDSAFHRLSAADVRTVLSGKLVGALLLDEITRDAPLDFLILLSGAGLSLGSPGQSAYLAANAGLDAVAQRRRASGLTALSVALGPWQGGGMAAALSEGGRDIWAERGVPAISPADAFAAIEAAITQGRATITVARIDWPKFLRNAPAGLDMDMFERFKSSNKATTDHAPQAPVVQQLPDRIRALPDALRSQAMADALADLARVAINLPDGTSIPPFAPLKDAGLDSLMSVEFRNMLVRAGGLPLPVTLLFDHPTLDDLVRHLALAWSVDLAAPQHGLADDTHDELSDDDALAQLEAELAGSTTSGARS